MKLYKNFRALIVFVLVLVPAFSDAQWYDRLEIGYSYVMATAQYSGSSPYIDNSGNVSVDTASKRTIKSSAGAGYDIGFSIPLKRVGRQNMWALSIHVVYNEFIWESLNQAYSANGDYVTVAGYPDLYGATLQIGMPIGIDYKIGTDAICTKRRRLGCTFGAGIFPTYNATAMLGVDNAGVGLGYGVSPYAKAELAIFGGLCFKFRALYSFGGEPYIDQTKNDLAFTSGPFKVTGKSNLMLSFIIMPFAWHWKEQEWWNTYGRYNPWQ